MAERPAAGGIDEPPGIGDAHAASQRAEPLELLVHAVRHGARQRCRQIGDNRIVRTRACTIEVAFDADHWHARLML